MKEIGRSLKIKIAFPPISSSQFKNTVESSISILQIASGDMPNNRNSFFIPTVDSTTPRRSPRFLHHITTSQPPQQPRTPRKLQDSKSFSSKSTCKSVCSSNPSSSYSNSTQFALSSLSYKGLKNTSSKKSNSGNVNSAPSELRRSSRLSNGPGGFPCLRRSSRLSRRRIQFLELSDSPRSRGSKKSRKSDHSLVDSENPTKLNSRVRSLRRSQRLLNNTKHVSFQNIDSDSDFSVEEEGTNQVEDKPIEGREGQVRYDNKSESLVNGKRKRDEVENSEETKNGWSKEQEVALQRAYLAAKPTPHFWKKVSKLVPGKSAQDCFERIHQDHLTPPQHQPRSRAKKLKSSPLEEVLLSASKLLKPIVNKSRRSGCSKSKGYLTQKSLRKLSQFNRKVDPDHEGDLFSVLEPDVDFPSNAFQPSGALSTPEKLDEKQGWLQSCNEKSSSRHGKPLSRFNSPCGPDIASPAVLKQVKNRVLHEKYINQLRCREARRRAASARVEISKLGIAVSKESNVQKGGLVESAKIALVSEARDAIEKFQHSQANLMEGCSSDEDTGDHVDSFDDDDESQ